MQLFLSGSFPSYLRILIKIYYSPGPGLIIYIFSTGYDDYDLIKKDG